MNILNVFLNRAQNRDTQIPLGVQWNPRGNLSISLLYAHVRCQRSEDIKLAHWSCYKKPKPPGNIPKWGVISSTTLGSYSICSLLFKTFFTIKDYKNSRNKNKTCHISTLVHLNPKSHLWLSMKHCPQSLDGFHCLDSQPGEPRSWRIVLNGPLNQVEISWAQPVSA